MRKAWSGVRQQLAVPPCAVVGPSTTGMSRQFVRGITHSQHERAYLQRLRQMEAEAAAGKTWRLVGGIAVQRLPLIIPTPDPIEEQYEQFRFDRDNYFSINVERNLELMEEDRRKGSKISKTQKKKKEKKEGVSDAGAAGGKQKGGEQDEADSLYQKAEETAYREETLEDVRAKMERLSPRITAADLANDRKSLNRALASRLYLIVQKPRTEHAWQFPQGGRESGETMRQCCERELREEIGTKMKVHFWSNAPAGCYSYPYPDNYSHNDGHHGSKVFFYHAEYVSGEPHPDNKEVVDFAWVTRDELQEYFDPQLFKFVRDMLPA